MLKINIHFTPWIKLDFYLFDTAWFQICSDGMQSQNDKILIINLQKMIVL